MPRYTLRGIAPPHRKQREIIDYLLKPDSERVKQVDVACGRGFGKSVFGLTIANVMMSMYPRSVGLFLEPDWKRVYRVFLKKWRRIVPPELYEINQKEQLITYINGSLLYYGPRNITGSHQTSEDSQLGQDLTYIVDDEAALRCNARMYANNLATIREHNEVRFYLTLSTPRSGAYKNLVHSPGHILFRGRSSDNPYLPADYEETLRMNMSPEQARREIEGEFTSLNGRIWHTADLETPWPNGNRNDALSKFDPKRPWWLFCDFGSATGAYAVVQQMKARYMGRELFRKPVWTAVADFCPREDASATRAFRRLKDEFGIPVAIVGGDDINTRDRSDGRTVAYFAKSIFGSQIQINAVNESTLSKRTQHDRLSYLMCSATNQRRFTVARHFVSLDPFSRRGIREMIEEDEMPEESKRRLGEFLPKNKENTVQHIRDALMMGAVAVMAPPDWEYDDDEVAA